MLTEAIVIKTWPYSESSLIVWLLGRECGSVRALAKGARRLKGRSPEALDLFSQIRVSVRLPRGDGLGSMGSVELKRTWPYLRGDLGRLTLASLAMETLGSVASHSAPEPYYYMEAVEYLEALEHAEGPGSLTACLLLRLLEHAGYPPRPGPGIDPEALPEKVAYDFGEGTFIGGTDASGASGGARRTMALPRGFVENLMQLQGAPPLDGSFLIPSRHGTLVLQWLVAVWEDHLHQKLRSAKLLETLTVAAR